MVINTPDSRVFSHPLPQARLWSPEKHPTLVGFELGTSGGGSEYALTTTPPLAGYMTIENSTNTNSLTVGRGDIGL